MRSGAWLVYKKSGLSSSDVVQKIKRALVGLHGAELSKKFKIGHGGTLDPFAEGVLIVLLGEATKLADVVLHSYKSYEAILALGKKTNSADLTGQVITEQSVPLMSPLELDQTQIFFLSQPYFQTPPMVSAKKMNGTPLYELARKGEEVERKALLKKIETLELKLLTPSTIRIRTRVESGTYIRTLGEDIAQKLGTVGHLTSLTRTEKCGFKLHDCTHLEQILAAPFEACISLSDFSKNIPSVILSDSEVKSITQGLSRVTESIIENKLNPRNETYILGVKMDQNEKMQPHALFHRQEGQYRLQRVIHEN